MFFIFRSPYPKPSQKRQHRASEQHRKFIPSVLIVSLILGVGVTAISSYWVVRSLILKNLQQNALLKLQNSGSEIDRWLTSLQVQVESLANNSAVRSMDWSVAEPYLQLEQDRLPDFHMFTLANPDGSYYTTKVGFAKGKNIIDRSFFGRSMSGYSHISELNISRSTGIRQTAISATIWSIPKSNRPQLSEERAAIRAKSLAAFNLPNEPSQQPEPIGVLAGLVAVDRISNVVNKISYGQGSYAFAIDSKGVPIAHPNRRILENAKSFLDQPNPSLTPIYQAMVKGKKGIQLVQIESKRVYVAYTPLHQASWSVALVIPRQNLEAQLGALNILASGLGIILILATIIALRQWQLFEQNSAKANQESLLNSITARIGASLDLEIILQTTLDEVASLLHLDRVTFSWYRVDEGVVETVCEHRREDLPGQLACYSLKDFGDLGDRLRRHEIIVINDAVNDSGIIKTLRQAFLEAQVYSHLALPVAVQDDKSGYLTCIRTKPWVWSDREIELLKAVTDRLAIAIKQSHLLAQTEEQAKIANEQAKRLSKALTKLQKTQTQLIQSEKMSSLGQLVAGVAHEINNPVNFIHGNLIHANQYTENLIELLELYAKHYPQPVSEIEDKIEEIDLEFISEDLPKMLSSMHLGTDRIRQIVLSLRNFSRLEQAEMKAVDIHEGIDNTLLILQHRLKAKAQYPEIKLIKEYGKLPLIECYAGQLNQVFMNIISNAIDALEIESELPSNERDKIPTIRISTEVLDRNRVVIRIADNGQGMTEKVKKQLFNPFFTTKPVGKGTGLGLSISYQIVVEKHGGVLQCLSELGKGTEFWIEIPIIQHAAKQETSGILELAQI